MKPDSQTTQQCPHGYDEIISCVACGREAEKKREQEIGAQLKRWAQQSDEKEGWYRRKP